MATSKRINLIFWLKHSMLSTAIMLLTSCGQGMSEQQMLDNARTYLSQGQLQAASIELRNTLQENSENAEARYLLGSIYLKTGDIASAEKEFRRATTAGWSQEAVQLQLARIFIRKKEFKKFLDEIEAADTWSVDARANIAGLRALAEAGLKNVAKAKTSLDEGKLLNKNAVEILKTTALLQLTGMLEGDASNTLKTAKSLYPDNPEILLLHASNDIQHKKLTRAAETYNRVIALDQPKFITASGRRARIGLTRLQILEENHSEAEATLAPLLKNHDNDPEANYLAGLLAFTQGDFSRAENHIRKLLVIMPDNIQAQHLLGKIKYALKDFDQATHLLAAYLNAVPNDISTRKLLTNTYIILNRPAQARATLHSALIAKPGDAEVLTLLSQIEFYMGNMGAGIAALNKAVKSSPDNAQLHRQLAKAYITTGQTALTQRELKIYQNLSNDTEGTQKLNISAHLQAGQIKKALNIAKEMLANNPKNPNTLALLGGLYADNNNYQQARIYFNKAMQIEKNHPAATVGLARIERKNGNFDKAIALYKSLVDANKAGTTPMIALSEIAALQKRNNDMVSWLEKARNVAPTEIRARIILAKYYLQNAQTQKAEIYTKEAIKLSPENTDLIALHGKVMIAQQRYSEALPPLKKLVAKIPESVTAHSLLGETFLRLHMLSNAREHLEKALLIQPNNATVISLLAETELKDGNLKRSRHYAKTLQKEWPDHYVGYMQEGDIWMAKQNYAKAQSAYINAWKLKQTARLAKKLSAASKDVSLDEAIKPLLTWLKDNPDDHSTRFYLATRYQNANQNDKAAREYENILKQAPDNSLVLNNLAWLYLLNDNPRAADMAERAYRFAPENPGVLDTYGWILVQQGQVEKGKRIIKQAMDIIPENPDIRYHYAATLLKSGNGDEGRQILEELLRKHDTFSSREEAKQLLKKL